MGELQCGNVHPGGIIDEWIRVPGNRNLSQPRAALCWQARLAESVSRKGFFLCLGRTRFRANYSCTVPELQGGEGCQESLMQPPETLQDDWKGIKCCWINNCIRFWQTASLQLWEGNKQRQNCLVYAPHSSFHTGPSRNKHLSNLCGFTNA